MTTLTPKELDEAFLKRINAEAQVRKAIKAVVKPKVSGTGIVRRAGKIVEDKTQPPL